MTEELPRTPEGDLIRRARERAVPKLSIRAASAAIGISPEHWGNVERGYKSAGGGRSPRQLDDVSAALIAKMAAAVGLTAEDMETEGRRPDAAEIMREIQLRRARYEPPPGFPSASPEQLADMQDYLDEAHLLLRRARRLHPGEPLTGALLFPDSPGDRTLWDALGEFGWPPEGQAWMFAAGKAWEQQDALDRKGRAAAGLARGARCRIVRNIPVTMLAWGAKTVGEKELSSSVNTGIQRCWGASRGATIAV